MPSALSPRHTGWRSTAGTAAAARASPRDWNDDKYPLAPAVVQTWSGNLAAEKVDFLTRGEADFHSFRTTFAQLLRREGALFDHIKPITDHQQNDATLRHYAPVFRFEQEKEVIEKF